MSTGENGTVRVHLLQVPVPEWQRASAHMEAIQREFDILGADFDQDSVPRRLIDLIGDIDVRFDGVGADSWAELRQAAERGQDRIDLVFDVPPETAAAARAMSDMMDGVDEFCREGGQLLTLATAPELASFRRWLLGEFPRQIEDGLPPSPWMGTKLSEAESETSETPRSTPDPSIADQLIRFEGDLDLTTASSLREEILSARSAGASRVTLDLTGVSFMDSVGLSLLVTAHQRMTEEGLRLRILLPEKLRLLFDIAGLTEVLQPDFVS